RVLNLEPASLEGVFAGLEQVGEAAGVAGRATEAIAALRARVEAVATRSAAGAPTGGRGVLHRPRVTLLEWIDPPFSSGHWGPELVELAGGSEGIGRAGERSRPMKWSEFVACCGFDVPRTLLDVPMLERQPEWARLPCVLNRRVYVADGSAYFSRPGP